MLNLIKLFTNKRLWKAVSKTRDEIIFRSLLESNIGFSESALEGDVEKAMKKVKSNVRANRIVLPIVFIFLIVGLALTPTMISSLPNNYPYAQLYVYLSTYTTYFVSIFTLFSIFGMIYTTSIFSIKIFDILSTLPLREDEVEGLTIFSFLGIYDTLSIISIFGYPVLLLVFTGNFIISLLVAIFSVFNVALALTALIYLSKLFYSRIMAVSDTKLKSFVKSLFVIGWGILFFGVYFFSTLFSNILPEIIAFFVSSSSYLNLLLFVYPLPFSYLLASVTTNTYNTAFYYSLVGSGFYIFLSIFGLSKGLKTLRSITHSEVRISKASKEVAEEKKEYSIKVTSKFLALIKKDFKLASRKPSYAFIFAFPIIMTLMQFFIFSSTSHSVPPDVIVFSTTFSLAFPFGIFSIYFTGIDGQAGSYLSYLPVKPSEVILNKSFFFILIYYIGLITMLVMGPAFFDLYTLSNIIVLYVIQYVISSISLLAVLLLVNSYTFYKMQTQGISLIALSSEYVLLIVAIIIELVGLLSPLISAMFLHFIYGMDFILSYAVCSIAVLLLYTLLSIYISKKL